MGDGTNKTILLVEDEALIAMRERVVLERLGYTVRHALSGLKAIEAFESDPDIDLVLMDIDLGRGMDGTEAASAILKDRDVPVIFLSSHTEPEIVERTENITSYGYIVKSAGETVLNASIKMAFKLFDARTRVLTVNRKLEATLHALPDLFFEVDAEGRYTDMYCPDASLLYKFEGELAGQRIGDVLPPEVARIFMSAIREAGERGVSRGRRYRLTVPAGRKWFEVSASRMISPQNESRFILICRDVTEQEKAEEDLQASKRRAEGLLNVSAEIILNTDMSGTITLLNDNGHRLLGYEPGELVGSNWIETCLPENARGEVRSFLEGLLRGGEDTLVPHENFVLCKDGRRKLIFWHNTVLRDGKGRVFGVLSSGEDIGEYKRLEARYRTIVEASPDNITMTDLSGRMIMYSPKAAPMFGFDPEDDQTGRPVTDFMVPEDRQRAADNLGRMARGEILGVEEYRGLRKDGSTFDMEINGEFIRDQDGVPEQILFIVRDITSRKRLIGKYKLLFDLSPVGIALFDFGSGRFLDANKALQRMLGYTRDELLEMTYMSLTAPEFRTITEDRTRRIQAGPIEPYVKEYVCKDGSRLPVSVTATIFYDDERRKVVWGLIEDIRARREAEHKVESLLAEKDLILKEVHHRIKNNFGVIKGILGMQAQSSPDERSAEAFRSTEGRVQSMALLYEKLYEAAGFVETSVRDYIPALTAEIVANFPNAAGVTVSVDVDDFALDARRLQPLGILVNELVTNSMKYAFAGRETGSLSVSVRRSGGRVIVSVCDDGVGLPAGLAPEDSPGFGLTLVSVLAMQLGGELRFERGGGTRAVFEFDV